MAGNVLTKRSGSKRVVSRKRSRGSVKAKLYPAAKTPMRWGNYLTNAFWILGSIFLFMSILSELLPQLSWPQNMAGLDSSSFGQRENLMGSMGSVLGGIFVALLGWTALGLPVGIVHLLLVRKAAAKSGYEGFSLTQVIFGWLGFLGSLSLICAVIYGQAGGGYFGFNLGGILHRYLNHGGVFLVALFGLFVSLQIVFEIHIGEFLKWLSMHNLSWFSKVISCLVKVLPSLVLEAFAACGKVIKVSIHSIGLLALFISKFTRLLFAPLGWVWRQVASLNLKKSNVATDLEQQIADTSRSHKVHRSLPVESGPLASSVLTLTQEIGIEKSRTSKPVIVATRRRNEEAQKKSKPTLSPQINADFKFPPSELLMAGSEDKSIKPSEDALLENCRLLEKSLLDFKIGGRIVEVQPGPVITLYQFEPAPGIKVQRIVSLADDLALSLKVASVRVYAPVPGKGTVGIEVPNSQREIVRLRDLLESREYTESRNRLILALGKDTYGEPFVADLSKMPHLLIAGATGTGKSVCINSLLISLLYRNTPSDLRLLMIDPKMLELSVYESIPHLKSPVITNPKKARGVLWWAVQEMERRYLLMKELGVRNLAGYNKAVMDGGQVVGDVSLESQESSIDVPSTKGNVLELGASGINLNNQQLQTMPRIVIVVDELADLMLTVGKEIEELLTRLAQKARAAGIHLILATQRPSVNVITGLIKANFPSRISFQVASRIDSRTVLDSSGAERLLGMGDMLLMTPGIGRLRRLHAAYISDSEVQAVVKYLKTQGAPEYDNEIEEISRKLEENDRPSFGSGEDGDYDELYDQAVQLVTERGFASTSLVQRVFRIGYNRAARILETMEREGLVGPADGAKPRQLLVPGRDGL